MKKIFYLLILVLINTTSIGQVIDWGPTTKLKVSLSNEFHPKFNNYLGTVNGHDYYTYLHRATTVQYSNKIDFVFIKAKKNDVILFTKSTEIHYNYISIQIIDNQIAVFYFDDTNVDKWEIKVDFYSLDNFTIIKTLTLYSFKPLSQISSITKFSVSENKSLFGIMTLVTNPETNTKAFLIKTFDFQLQEQSETYFDVDINGPSIFRDLIINNDGSSFFSISEYKIENNQNEINKLHLIYCNDESAYYIQYQEDEMEEPCDYLLVKSNSNKDKLIITEKNMIKVYDLFFKTEQYSELNTNIINEGKWIIDQTYKLANGNFFIALTNTGTEKLALNNSVITVNYFKNFNFFCLDADLNQLVYDTKVGRYYSVYNQYTTLQIKTDVKPFYILNKNNVTVIFNNDDSKYIDEIDDTKKIVSNRITENSNIQKTNIDENGEVHSTILTNSSFENGNLINGFCHTNSDETITIAKKKGKQITFGTIFQ